MRLNTKVVVTTAPLAAAFSHRGCSCRQLGWQRHNRVVLLDEIKRRENQRSCSIEQVRNKAAAMGRSDFEGHAAAGDAGKKAVVGGEGPLHLQGGIDTDKRCVLGRIVRVRCGWRGGCAAGELRPEKGGG
jgi:hypothetical protein